MIVSEFYLSQVTSSSRNLSKMKKMSGHVYSKEQYLFFTVSLGILGTHFNLKEIGARHGLGTQLWSMLSTCLVSGLRLYNISLFITCLTILKIEPPKLSSDTKNTN